MDINVKAQELFEQTYVKSTCLNLQEITTLLTLLREYPDNRQEAYRRFAEIYTNRTFRSAQNFFYRYIMENNNVVINTTGSKNGFTSNRKNMPVKEGEVFQRQQPLKPVMFIMRELLNLSSEERRAIADFLRHCD